MEGTKDDLRYASEVERRYALAYLRWLAGRHRRTTPPRGTHYRYGLTPERDQQIREHVTNMVRDAAERVRHG